MQLDIAIIGSAIEIRYTTEFPTLLWKQIFAIKDAFRQNIIHAIKPNDRLIIIHFIMDFFIP